MRILLIFTMVWRHGVPNLLIFAMVWSCGVTDDLHNDYKLGDYEGGGPLKELLWAAAIHDEKEWRMENGG